MLKSLLLDQYCEIHDEINKMKNTINNIKYETKVKLQYSRSEKEKDNIMNSFREGIDKIRKDIKFKKKYSDYKFKQLEIKQILTFENIDTDTNISIMSNNFDMNNYCCDFINKNLYELLNKYKNNRIFSDNDDMIEYIDI
jgi:hypothetical protein